MTSGLNRALNFRSRGAIRTHRIQSYDAWHGVACGCLAGFFDFHYFSSFVIAALGAGAMRHLLLVAVRALGEGVLGKRIVGTAGRGSFLRMSPFRIWHEKFLIGAEPLGPSRNSSYIANLAVYVFTFAVLATNSMVELLANVFQGRPARIAQGRRAGAWFDILISAAGGAKPLALVAANYFYGNCQEDLLAKRVLEQDPFTPVVPHFGFGRGNREFLSTGVGALRAIQQLEGPNDILHNRVEAAGAGEFQIRR